MNTVTTAEVVRNEGTPLSVRWLRGALGATAFVVVVEAALGFAGATAAAAPVIGLAVCAGGAVAAVHAWRAWKRPDGSPSGTPWTAADAWAALALAVAVASRLVAGLHHAADSFTYDVLSYHLHLPASWWAAGRIGVVPTPFGDQAPAYAPGNAELTYLLALAVTGNLRLAHAGQAPFAGLAALALVATARQLGASRRLSCGGALAFLMIPEVWQQATEAMADLALASFVLACLPFLLRLSQGRSAADVAALGAGLGLALGTKYAGAVLVGPLVAAGAILLVRGGDPAVRARPLSRPAAAALLAILSLACGGFWYVRNAAMTGDPTFPVTLSLAGVRLGPGLYGGAEMRRWLYHLPVRDLQPLLEMFAETGWGFLVCLGGAFIVLPGRRRTVALGLFGALVALVWLALPYQQSRFLFPAWGTGAAAAAVAANGLRRVPLRELALGPAVVGAALQFPTPARLLTAGLWAVAAGLGARAGDGPPRESDLPAAIRWLGPAGLALLAVSLTGWTRLRPDPRLAVVGDGHDAGWAYVRAHLSGRHIAYTGSNLPLPLWGWRLENRVRYVNVAGKLTDVLHDFRRVPDEGGTAEPAPERAAPDRVAWLANLSAAGTDALFVARLYPEVAPSMPHDADGFPTERAWADTLPARFRLAFATPEVRIYDVRDLAKHGQPWPAEGPP